MKLPAVLCIITSLLTLSCASPKGAAEINRPTTARPPNIVLIVADDLGWGDISLRGGAPVQTPNIDAIAHRGGDFRAAYASHPVCAPSRAGLMTGRDQHRFGFEANPTVPRYARAMVPPEGDPTGVRYLTENEPLAPPPDRIGMPSSETTIAEALKSAGYATGFFGKWHLGSVPGMRPQDQGFDTAVGLYSGASMFAEPGDPTMEEARLPWSPTDRALWNILRYRYFRNGEEVRQGPYQTDLWADEAVDFIESHRTDPFFIYLAFNAPHSPLQAPREIYDELGGIADHNTRVYYAMVVAMDRAIGRVTAALDAAGLSENTIVVFTSDNGGADYTRVWTHNRPYRGYKATFWDGGLRVPLLVRWPGVIAPGTVSSGTASLLDIAPTLAAAASPGRPSGLPLAEGRDLREVFGQRAFSRQLAWRAGSYRASIDGRWKFIEAQRPQKTWLYDLEADPGEQTNLAIANPEEVARQRSWLDRYFADMPPPGWPALIEAPVFADPVIQELCPENACLDPEDYDFVYWRE